jgi:hypothetical protein
MKCMASIAAASVLIWLTGCASSPDQAVFNAVGPAPAGPTKVSSQGYLVVYSARQSEPLAWNYWEWERDYNLGDEALNYGLAHTGYIIRTENGDPVEYVHNSKSPTDSHPAVVALPPGRYEVEARAQEPDGQAVSVALPVVIEPGKTTVAHLTGNWKPRTHFDNADVVRLPDGQIAGWLARE